MRSAPALIASLLCLMLANRAWADVELPCNTRWGFGAPGLNLALEDCGEFGGWRSTVNCAMNSGLAINAVASVIPPAGIDRVVGVEGYFEVQTSGRTISPWWSLDGCRASALTFSADFTAGPYSCNDFWAGQAAGGGGWLGYSPLGAIFEFHCVFASPNEQAMDPLIEHYLFRVRVSRMKSSGADACPGCEDRACLVLNQLVLVQPAGVGDWTITWTASGNHVLYGDHLTPTANRTWGQVKALYR